MSSMALYIPHRCPKCGAINDFATLRIPVFQRTKRIFIFQDKSDENFDLNRRFALSEKLSMIYTNL